VAAAADLVCVVADSGYLEMQALMLKKRLQLLLLNHVLLLYVVVCNPIMLLEILLLCAIVVAAQLPTAVGDKEILLTDVCVPKAVVAA
jgi:hypothetical protein